MRPNGVKFCPIAALCLEADDDNDASAALLPYACVVPGDGPASLSSETIACNNGGKGVALRSLDMLLKYELLLPAVPVLEPGLHFDME